jgi:hypothetical protein
MTSIAEGMNAVGVLPTLALVVLLQSATSNNLPNPPQFSLLNLHIPDTCGLATLLHKNETTKQL